MLKIKKKRKSQAKNNFKNKYNKNQEEICWIKIRNKLWHHKYKMNKQTIQKINNQILVNKQLLACIET